MSDATLRARSEVEAQHDDARAKRAVAILVWAQSVLGSQMGVHFILGGLTGALLAEDKSLATLPISMTVLGSMFAAPALSALMGRFGRRPGFVLAALTAACGAGLAAWAIVHRDFALFCAASMMLGVYMAAQALYRFAAADAASPAFRPKAISWVMAGGLVSAVLGPEIVVRFQDLLAPVPYAGGYLAIVALNLVGVVPDPLPRPAAAAEAAPRPAAGPSLAPDHGRPPRPRRHALRHGQLCADEPGDDLDAARHDRLRLRHRRCRPCGAHPHHRHVRTQLFTGTLIARFGAPKVIVTGLALLTGCAVVALTGVTLPHFGVALALLGVGWNFGFIGATAMLAMRPSAGGARPRCRA